MTLARGRVLVATGIVLAVTMVPARGAVARFLFHRGLQAKAEWRLDDAVRAFEWSSFFRSDFIDATFERGICHQLRGNFLASQREFDRLNQTVLTDSPLRARLLNAVGVNRFNANEPDAALEAHERSLRLARQLLDRRLEAQALIDSSRVLYHSKGQADKALEYLRQALDAGRELRDLLIEADASRNIGVVLWWHKGELNRTISAYYEPALAIYRRLNDLRGVATTLSNIGLVHWSKGDLYQFMLFQNESLALRHRIGDIAGLSDSYAFLGWMNFETGNYRKARDHYTKSLALSTPAGYRLGQHDAENELAKVFMNLGEFDAAIDALTRLLAREHESPLLAKYRVLWLADAYRLKSESEPARQLYERALALEQAAPDPRFKMGVLTKLGQTYTAPGDSSTAFELLDRAREIALAQKERFWVEEVLNNLALAELSTRQGRRDEAFTYVLEAAAIESRAFEPSDRQNIRRQDRPTYERLFTLLLKEQESPAIARSAPSSHLAFRLLEQLRYRTFRNLMVRVDEKENVARQPDGREPEELSRIARASREWRNPQARADAAVKRQLDRAYSDYEDAVLRSGVARTLVRDARPATLEAVQEALDSDTALIEYLFGGDDVFALVITPAALRSVAIPITVPRLAAKVKLFRSLIFDGTSADDSNWRPVAEDLRRVLVEPLEQTGALTGVRRLGFVPYGFLHDLPLAALARADLGRATFLIEDYSIFYTPSATYVTSRKPADRPGRKAAMQAGGHMIAFGRNESDEADLPPLSRAAEEARSVARSVGGEVLEGRQATETELKRRAHQFTFIHLSTHAVSEPQMPLLSRLKLQPTREDDGNLSVREILTLGLHAELVTLGACQTGQSFSSSGIATGELDRIGLIDAFLHAGARSVLASLSPVADRPTTEFMKAFYQHLRSHDKTDALAVTQRAMLRGELSYGGPDGPRRLTHPRYWAPFVLVGDEQ